MSKYFLFCDGGARGNPGPAAIGYAVFNSQNKLIFEEGKKIGQSTNNKAEYQAVIAGLEKVGEVCEKPIEIKIYLDSELVVHQLNGKYKVKEASLKPFFWQIRDKIMALGGAVSFSHIPRRKNKHADFLVNKALDGKLNE